MAKKETQQHVISLLKILSIVSLLLAVVFIVLLFLSKSDNIQTWYQTYQRALAMAEIRVENMENRSYIFVVILFLFAFKAVFPIYLYPLPALCAVTSTVFEPYFSLPINILGLVILYSIKYYWGKRVGANSVQIILKRNKTVRYFIENEGKDGKGNPLLLPLFRFTPGIPINLISQLYGAMGFRYRNFLLLSLLGYTPLLVFYTFIGRNVFNPLSTAFLLPFILLFFFISVSMYTLSKILQRRKKNNG